MGNHPRWLAALVVSVAASACGPSTPPVQAQQPRLVVKFVPSALVPDERLTLTTATMRLGHVNVFGNAPPPGPPPTGGTPDGGAPKDRLDFTALTPGGGELTFDVPQGLYSLVEFHLENIDLDGTWKGVTFHARPAGFPGPKVDLRADDAQEALPDQTITFTVAVDPNAWFANAVLDGAKPATGMTEIFCDDLNNTAVAHMITTQMAGSFSLK
jgi:hypothetical protein